MGKIIKISKNKSAIIKSQSSKDGKVIIHFDERDDIKSVEKNLTDEFGENVSFTNSIIPKIKIVGIPAYIDTKDTKIFKEKFLSENEELKCLMNCTENIFEILFSYERSQRGNVSKTALVKVSPEIRKYLLNSKIIIASKICKIYDNVHVKQC